MKPLPLDQNTPMSPVPVPVCERIYLLDEDATARGEWAEVGALMPTRTKPLTLRDSSAYEIPATAEDPRGHRAAGPVNTSPDVEALINDLLADFRAVTVCGSARAEFRSAIAIEAAVPGAGKTFLIKA